MIFHVDRALAQQIVSTVKDVCGQDINFIDQSGMIFASTNQKRIGDFHEIGYKAFYTGEVIEVESDNSFTGTQRGINLPVSYHHEVLAVIGISGDPQSVRKYAYLAERITRLLIREQEVNALGRSRDEKKQFLIHALIGQQKISKEYLDEYLKEFEVNPETEKRLLLVRLDARFHPGNTSMLEQKLKQMFELLRIRLYTFDFPNDYLAVLEADAFDRNRYILKKFCSDYQDILKLAVGKVSSVYRLADSYESAQIAWRSISAGQEGMAVFEELTLEILLSAVDEGRRAEFLHKTTAALTKEELELMKVYFEEDMSLSGTCGRLYLHKNTLQYRLNRIEQKCGFNPRRFRDAVVLYLAGKLTDTAG